MKIKCLEKGTVFYEFEYDLPEDVIENDPALKNIITLYKKGKPLNYVAKEYLYKILNYEAKVIGDELVEEPEVYTLEEIQDYEG